MNTIVLGRAIRRQRSALERGGTRRFRDTCRLILRRTIIARAVTAVGAVPPARAEPAPPYSALLRQAEVTAPVLLEARANIRAAEGREDQARVLPNPSVGFLSENLGSHTSGGFAAWQNTLSASEPIEFGGKRGARIAAATAETHYSEAEASRIQIDFAYDLAIAYVAAESAQARSALYETVLQRKTCVPHRHL